MQDFSKKINAWQLALFFIAAVIAPNVILTITEDNPFWVAVACLLIPLGGYTAFAAFVRRSGVMVWLGFPAIFFSAFQIVLLYLFGGSVIAADMFLNLVTTNVGEAGELLANIYPAIIVVVVIYVPLLYLATAHICRKVSFVRPLRRRFVKAGCVMFALGCVILFAGSRGQYRRVVKNELFPVNVAYNMWFAASQHRKIEMYPQTSAHFSYHSQREESVQGREVYVLVIGEASRAASWQMYGYERATNPLLSQRDDIVLFENVITQSNTTHKSVPMILSSVHTSQHDEIYRRKGLPALFNEAGFTTYFLSNQTPQGAMIDHLAGDAQHIEYVAGDRMDMLLVESMRKALQRDKSEKILFILHTYGSHFSYCQRYPRQMAHFTPDDDVAITRKNIEMIRNAYDNSIIYTDYMLSQVIGVLEELEGVTSAMYYCSDHGEDLFDGDKKRFLHSSPMVTYHQLHIPAFAWFSPEYKCRYKDKVEAAKGNVKAPATTYSVFHTMADMASIKSQYVVHSASLFNEYYDFGAERYYLNDHNRAVTLDRYIGIDAEQRAFFTKQGISL